MFPSQHRSDGVVIPEHESLAHWIEAIFHLAKFSFFPNFGDDVCLLVTVSLSACAKDQLVNTSNRDDLKFEPQAILAIIVAEERVEKIICPSNPNFYAFVKRRDKLPVFLKYKGLLAEMIHDWDEENEDFLLEETAAADFKETLCFKLLEVAPKPEVIMPNREMRKHNEASDSLTITPIGSLLTLIFFWI